MKTLINIRIKTIYSEYTEKFQKIKKNILFTSFIKSSIKLYENYYNKMKFITFEETINFDK